MPDGLLRAGGGEPWTPSPSQERPASLRAIREIACDEFGVNWSDLRADDRRVNVVGARRAFCWLAYCYPYDAPEIGEVIDRECATVRAMIARADAAIICNPAVANRMLGLALVVDAAVRGCGR